LRILKHYSQYTNVNGILVYATCSIMPQENQDVINEFLSNNKEFEPSPLIEAFEQYNIEIEGLKNEDFCLNLLPSVHGTDGFFMARMRRVFQYEKNK